MSAIEKLLAEGWQELELGQPDWLWFIRGQENAYIYILTGHVFFAQSFREAIKKYDLPVWALERGSYLMKLYFVDPSTIKKEKNVQRKLREGSGNFQNNLFKKIG